jgi:hypothetical protein
MRVRFSKSIIAISGASAVLSIPASAYAGNDKETASETLKRLMEELEADGLERVIGPAARWCGRAGSVPFRSDWSRPAPIASPSSPTMTRAIGEKC